MSLSDPTREEMDVQVTRNAQTIEEAILLQGIESKQSVLDATEQEKETAFVSEEPTPAAEAPIPAGPLPPRRPVSGLYVGRVGTFELHLRIDVDGRTPLRKASGDFYQVSGGTTMYFGSFIVDSITLGATTAHITIEGTGTYTWSAGAPKVPVIIPRTFIFQPPAPATLQFFTLTNQPGATYVCQFKSIFFRTVDYEQDWESGVTPLVSYNTGSLPSGGPARVLSVASAYGEAGIEFRVSIAANETDNSLAGPDTLWSDRELHTAMERHFSLWRDEPQWKVWLYAGIEHDIGPTLYGIMFDQIGKQRQGCATFHKGIGGNTAEQLRLQLYTYVHELGHCFNFLHSWQKSLATPPLPDRPLSLSWMNYPWRFPPGGPSGAAAFWNSFPFAFDELELRHLRHGFRDNVVMGGNDFIVGSALTSINDRQAFAPALEDHQALRLTLKSIKTSYPLGSPIEIEIKLSNAGANDVAVVSEISPRFEFVQLAIRCPDSRIIQWDSMIKYCIRPTIMKLGPNSAFYESIYIGFSKMEGLVFTTPGTYYVRGIYSALDGSRVVSDILPVVVSAPLNSKDQEVAQLLNRPEVGKLFYLLGSYSPTLREGNEAFEQVSQNFGDTSYATYVNFVQGVRAATSNKKIAENGKVIIEHKADPNKSVELLSSAVGEKGKRKEFSPITQADTMRLLATLQKSILKDEQAVKRTLKQMIETLSKQITNQKVIEYLEKQAKRSLELDTRKAESTFYTHTL